MARKAEKKKPYRKYAKKIAAKKKYGKALLKNPERTVSFLFREWR